MFIIISIHDNDFGFVLEAVGSMLKTLGVLYDIRMMLNQNRLTSGFREYFNETIVNAMCAAYRLLSVADFDTDRRKTKDNLEKIREYFRTNLDVYLTNDEVCTCIKDHFSREYWQDDTYCLEGLKDDQIKQFYCIHSFEGVWANGEFLVVSLNNNATEYRVV